MFNFLKNKKEEESTQVDTKSTEKVEESINTIEEPVEEQNEPVNAMNPFKKDINFLNLLEQLEYTNTYLAQLLIINKELLKQQTVANGLTLLSHQYEHADSFMSVEEIQDKYLALAHDIFLDYAQELENLNNLEEKD